MDLEGPPPPTYVAGEGPRWGGKVDLAKVTLGVRVVPPPVCTHARTTFQTAWQSPQAASLTKKLRTVEFNEYTPGKSASADAAALPMRA